MVSEITKEQKHGKYFVIKIIAAIAVAVAIILGGIYFIEAYESYMPYEETGITITDNGSVYTDMPYSRYNSYQYVTETVDGVHHCIVFAYMTSSIYSRHFEKQPESKRMIENYSFIEGESEDNGEVLEDVVTEAYYLPEKYLTEKGFVKKHPELIPIGTSEQEQKDMIDQIKADSVLLWKRK